MSHAANVWEQQQVQEEAPFLGHPWNSPPVPACPLPITAGLTKVSNYDLSVNVSPSKGFQ